MMKSNFIKCGMIGWCLEVAWTGLGSLLRHDPKLTGVSSLTMFPIYGWPPSLLLRTAICENTGSTSAGSSI